MNSSDRLAWSRKETQDFLEICKDRKVAVRFIMVKPLRLHDIFFDVTADMENIGYKRTTSQLIFKYKKLRQRYREIKKTGEEVDEEDACREFEFFKILDDMHKEVETMEESQKSVEKYNAGPSTSSKTLSVKIEKTTPEEYSVTNLIDVDPLNDEDATNFENLADQSEYEREQEEQVDSDDQDYEQPAAKRTRKTNERTRRNASYYKSKTDDAIDKMVNSFKNAQGELQETFFKKQLILQKQQQEWEEKVMDEEREFFTKVLNSVTRKHF